MAFAGMVGGDDRALIMVAHQGVDRRQVLDVLARRWPSVVLKDLEHEEPVWAMSADDAAELGMRRRGVEPLRIMVDHGHAAAGPARHGGTCGCYRADARGDLTTQRCGCRN
jgi:hypothetical protein